MKAKSHQLELVSSPRAKIRRQSVFQRGQDRTGAEPRDEAYHRVNMIETTIPEINASDLMARVRAKTAELQKVATRGSNRSAALQRLELPPLAVVPPTPPLILPQPAPTRKERVLSMLEQARGNTEVSSWIPKPIRRFFRKQGGYNRMLLESVTVLTKGSAELANRLKQLTACVEIQHGWLCLLQQRSEGDRAWMSAAGQGLGAAVDGIDRVSQEVQRFSELRNELDHISKHLRNLQNVTDRNSANDLALQKSHEELLKGFQSLRGNSERSGEHVRNLQREVERNAAAELALHKSHEELWNGFQSLRGDGERSAEHVQNLQREVELNAAAELALQKNHEDLLKGFQSLRGDGERSGEHLRNLQREVERNAAAELALQKNHEELLKGFQALRSDAERRGEHLRNLQSETARNQATSEGFRREFDRLDAGHSALTGQVSSLEERLTTEGAFFRAQLSNHGSLIQRWSGGKSEAGGALRKLDSSKKAPLPAFDERFDAFYMSFEDRFRGSRNEIKERISFYLPYIWESNFGGADRPVLDLGCGRGEWLELLRDIGSNARGVDINSAMLALCRHRRLDVVQADALEYLRSLPDNSQSAVTGFHIIEHLAFDILMDVFAETQRVVAPGGLVIFESPNCKNLIVGACNFNIDPTHRNPVFPDTAKFMLDMVGFQRVELEYLTPMVKTPFDGKGADQPVLKDLLYGPQDFAVIGYKAAAS